MLINFVSTRSDDSELSITEIASSIRPDVGLNVFPEGAATGWPHPRPYSALIPKFQSIKEKAVKPALVGAVTDIPFVGGVNGMFFLKKDEDTRVFTKTALTGHEVDRLQFMNPSNMLFIDEFPIGIGICYDLERDDGMAAYLVSQGAKLIIHCKYHRSPPGTWKPAAWRSVLDTLSTAAAKFDVPIVSLNCSMDRPEYVLTPYSWQMSHNFVVDRTGFPLFMEYPTTTKSFVLDTEKMEVIKS